MTTLVVFDTAYAKSSELAEKAQTLLLQGQRVRLSHIDNLKQADLLGVGRVIVLCEPTRQIPVFLRDYAFINAQPVNA